MYLVFSFSVMVIEGPHMAQIYTNREKKSPQKTSTRTKKNN